MGDVTAPSCRYGLGSIVLASALAAGLGALVTRAASAEPATQCPEVAEAHAPEAAPTQPERAAALEPAVEADEPVLTDEAAWLAEARPPVPEGVRVAKVDNENFLVELRAKPSCAVNAEESFAVVVTSKGDYKINPQFPVKFKPSEAPEGLRYPKPVLKREDGRFEEKSGSFDVPFVATKAGKLTVGGTLSLSVCSDKRCLMDKVAVDAEIEAR